jgi:hypothetical protein
MNLMAKKSIKGNDGYNRKCSTGLAPLNELVDIKVCAVDEIWSGLKLVIPLRDRTPLVDIPLVKNHRALFNYRRQRR